MRRWQLGLVGILWAACGSDPPPAAKPAGPAGGEKAPAAPGAPAAAAPSAAAAGGAPAPTAVLTPPAPGRDKLLAEIRKRPFKPEDFVATPPTSTDPFHPNLASFVTAPPPPDKDLLHTLLPKYNLEELKLAAIITGASDGATARAMFIDPTGVGHNLKRGDRLSKSAALVQRILSDRVLFEFTEEAGQGKKRTVVRAVELHPTEGQSGSSGTPVAQPPSTPR